jgi:phosphoserine phosphatase RsbU/P
VQLALMPTATPSIPGWDIWLHTQPANDVGGDLVDHLPMRGDRHAIALGDVAGKALPAALLSVKLQATLRALAPQCATLSILGAEVNRIFCRDGLPSRFASLVYLDVHAMSGHVRVLNAGHMPPIVARANGASAMARGSVVLGIMEGAAYPEQSIDLDAGDVLVVYSDGVSEAINEAGDFFGDERIATLAESSRSLPARAIGERLRNAVAAHLGDQAPNDDVSIMILKRTA